jgi:hypothetical protein
VIRNASFQRWRNTKRRMDAAKIVIREIEGASIFEVIPFLRVSVGQACKTAKRHANRKVAALHVTGGVITRVGATVPYFYYCPAHRSGTIASCRVLLAMIAVIFLLAARNRPALQKHLRLPCDRSGSFRTVPRATAGKRDWSGVRIDGIKPPRLYSAGLLGTPGGVRSYLES